MKKFQSKLFMLSMIIGFCISASAFGTTGYRTATLGIANANTQFWNVIGSANDQNRTGMTWINVWKTAAGLGVNSTVNCIVNPCANNARDGGHVVMANPGTNQTPAGSIVYILPLCQSHNLGNRGNGNAMSFSGIVTAVQLIGYRR